MTAAALVAASTVAVGGHPAGAARALLPAPPTYTWPKIAHDPGNSGLSADPAISAGNAATLGIRWMASTGASVVSSPVVQWNATLGETLVFLGNEAGYMTAFDASTGSIVWSVNLGSAIRSTPLVEGGSVWVSRAYSPYLYKLDASTGAVQCSIQLTSLSEGTPTIGTPPGGSTTIYIGVDDLGTSSGPIYAVNEANCGLDWEFTDFDSVSGTWDPLSFATDGTGRALVLAGTADPDDSVYAIDAQTGQKVWSFQTPPLSGNTDTDVGAGVSISPPGANGFTDGVAYVPAEDGYFFALDLTTGAQLWQYDFGTGLPQVHLSRSTPAIAGRQVVFGESGGVMCLDAITGADVWSFPTGGVESISTPAIVGPSGQQVVAVTTLAGAVDVLSLATGNLLYHYQTSGYTTSSVADVDGNLIAESANGFLYDFAPGGANDAPPSSAVTSPIQGSSVANRSGRLTVKGTASGTSIASVLVAVQSGGPSGPWWNGRAAAWTAGFYDNEAHLASPGSDDTTWSMALPAPVEGGTFRVLATSVQADGVADVSSLSAAPGAANVTFTLRNAPGAAELHVVGSAWVPPGGSARVRGSGFQAGETVTLEVAGTVVGSASASSTGALGTTAVVVPSSEAFGPAQVTATGAASSRIATATVQVANSWTESGYSSGHPGLEPDDTVLLDRVAPGPPQFLSQAWSYPTGAAVRASLAVSQDIAYFGNDNGVITALDVRNSQPVWTTTEPSAVDSAPAISPTELFVGTEGGSVAALQLSTGSPVWSTPTGSAVESAPALGDGNVYVGSDGGVLYAISQATGAVVWTANLGGGISGSPAVDTTAGLVIVGDASGAVTALSMRTGARKWTHMTGAAVTASASVSGGTVYVGSGDGNAYAFSESTGRLKWVTAASSPISTGGVLYTITGSPTWYVVGTQAGTILCLRAQNGAVTHELNAGSPITGLGGATGWISATTMNGQILGMKRNFDLVWEASSSSGFVAAPVVVDGVVYTAGLDQTVTAYTVPGVPIP